MRPDQRALLEMTIGEEDYEEMIRRLEFLDRLAKDIQEAPVEEREEKFPEQVIENAVEEGEWVLQKLEEARRDINGRVLY